MDNLTKFCQHLSPGHGLHSPPGDRRENLAGLFDFAGQEVSLTLHMGHLSVLKDMDDLGRDFNRNSSLDLVNDTVDHNNLEVIHAGNLVDHDTDAVLFLRSGFLGYLLVSHWIGLGFDLLCQLGIEFLKHKQGELRKNMRVAQEAGDEDEVTKIMSAFQEITMELQGLVNGPIAIQTSNNGKNIKAQNPAHEKEKNISEEEK